MSAVVVVGLGFGDEGKGTLVDWLARRRGAAAVVRHGGGPQATHHVVLPDGRWHGFSQLGAGTFVSGVATHLMRDVLIDPVSLLREAEVLREKGVGDALARLTIDPRAAVVMPFHKMIGQLAELARGAGRVGSVGLGVGEAARARAAGDALRLEDARDAAAVRRWLAERLPERLARAEALARQAGTEEAEERLRYFRRELEVERLANIVSGFVKGYARQLVPDEERLAALGDGVIYEGAQGALLDPAWGFPPFITKTPVIHGGAGFRLGVLRAYAHRHGPGPLPTEDAALAARLPERHNVWNRWQGRFRVGWFDRVLARYAVEAARVHAVALTCVDRLEELRAVTAYEHPGPEEAWFDEALVWRRSGGGLRIEGLRPGAARHGAAVARVLARCRPVAELRVAGPGELGELLGVPVAVVSAGATWRDKTELAAIG